MLFFCSMAYRYVQSIEKFVSMVSRSINECRSLSLHACTRVLHGQRTVAKHSFLCIFGVALSCEQNMILMNYKRKGHGDYPWKPYLVFIIILPSRVRNKVIIPISYAYMVLL